MAPKRKYRKLQIKPNAYRVGDTATPERQRQLGGIVERPLAYANNGKLVHTRQEARVECTLDNYRFRCLITDSQFQAGMMFGSAYKTAARNIKVSDYHHATGNGPGALHDLDRLSQARIRLKSAQGALPFEQYDVIESVAGWDNYAGNSRRLSSLRKGLDILFQLWF